MFARGVHIMMNDKYMHESFTAVWWTVACWELTVLYFFIYMSVNKYVGDGFLFCRVAGCLRADLPKIEDVEDVQDIETCESAREVKILQGTCTAINITNTMSEWIGFNFLVHTVQVIRQVAFVSYLIAVFCCQWIIMWRQGPESVQHDDCFALICNNEGGLCL